MRQFIDGSVIPSCKSHNDYHRRAGLVRELGHSDSRETEDVVDKKKKVYMYD